MSGEPNICEVGGSGLLLPFQHEQTWNVKGRAVLYLTLLMWSFLGVAIVADTFMAAIEAVTSKRKLIRLSNGSRLAVKEWNATVANLTLMALGTSAPEILLSCIELWGANMYSGDLGPGTIVGSASFNLMVIIAICVNVIPDGERRTIKQPLVFAITATTSVLAYLWLIVILSFWTPDIVTPIEGILTFLFFPLLVLVAYLADIGKFKVSFDRQADDARQQEQLDEMRKQWTPSDGDFFWDDLAEDDQKLLLREASTEDTPSRAQRRLQVAQSAGLIKAAPDVLVGFTCQVYAFGGSEEKVPIEIEKFGSNATKYQVGCCFRVYDSAKKWVYSDYMLVKNSDEKTCWEAKVPNWRLGREVLEEESYYVELFSAATLKKTDEALDVEDAMKNGEPISIPKDRQRVKFVITPEEDLAGGLAQLRFQSSMVSHSPWKEVQTTARLAVERRSNVQGLVKCRFRTVNGSARAGYDYQEVEGVVEFPRGAVEVCIEVPISRRSQNRARERFFVELFEYDEEVATLVVNQDGSTCAVTILASNEHKDLAAKCMRKLDHHLDFDALTEGRVKWIEQFVAAVEPFEGTPRESGSLRPFQDYLLMALYGLALPWKLLFALIPPTTYCGGWLCFSVALLCIGAVTTVIGDLAALMGCCMGIPDSITAITVVAMGTSLPDTFASKKAAVEDNTADNAIGNVTGSNCVNVFLGLGLPWMVASIVWWRAGATEEWVAKYPTVASRYPEGGFAILAGDLSFSVMLFTFIALISIGVILFRRRVWGAELGGPKRAKMLTSLFFFVLWFYYIGVASWKILTPSAGLEEQAKAVGLGFAGVLVLVAASAAATSRSILVSQLEAPVEEPDYPDNQDPLSTPRKAEDKKKEESSSLLSGVLQDKVSRSDAQDLDRPVILGAITAGETSSNSAVTLQAEAAALRKEAVALLDERLAAATAEARAAAADAKKAAAAADEKAALAEVKASAAKARASAAAAVTDALKTGAEAAALRKEAVALMDERPAVATARALAAAAEAKAATADAKAAVAEVKAAAAADEKAALAEVKASAAKARASAAAAVTDALKTGAGKPAAEVKASAAKARASAAAAVTDALKTGAGKPAAMATTTPTTARSSLLMSPSTTKSGADPSGATPTTLGAQSSTEGEGPDGLGKRLAERAAEKRGPKASTNSAKASLKVLPEGEADAVPGTGSPEVPADSASRRKANPTEASGAASPDPAGGPAQKAATSSKPPKGGPKEPSATASRLAPAAAKKRTTLKAKTKAAEPSTTTAEKSDAQDEAEVEVRGAAGSGEAVPKEPPAP
eukprot:CAMPEP_0203975116 /NCGR_PEP_ID=MMETSP0359-20131031/100448_1 /ASSEMBLY_ACC=CAM_ASM_000338 /TAXON_ID=268821 /ORGANISM="Scrippsiella Hangoei, Strain SHTV-5" /LENGTH=1303 /DNA_ID=CAMNT_0050913311 /DNA_START=12 /DNA_END=3919 /DNA_ORIENTATION=+